MQYSPRLAVLTTEEVVEVARQHLPERINVSGSLACGFHRGSADMSEHISVNDFIRYNGQPETVHLTPGITYFWVGENEELSGPLVLHEYTLAPTGGWVYTSSDRDWEHRLRWISSQAH